MQNLRAMNDLASVSKSSPLHFQIVFSGSAFLCPYHSWVFFFFNFLFPIKLYINPSCHFLSFSGVNFSPFWRPVLLLHLLTHCVHKGHNYLKCFDNPQLFALKKLSREEELHE